MVGLKGVLVLSDWVKMWEEIVRYDLALLGGFDCDVYRF